MSLLTGEPRSATVIAETSVDCYRLDKAAFQSLMDARPQIAEQIADLLTERTEQLMKVLQKGDSGPASRMSRADILGKIKSFFALD
jgi:CRP-like cAMP-binding protein